MPPAYDEAVAEDGTVRPAYSWLVSTLERIGPPGLLVHEKSRDAEQRARGMFFPQADDDERLFPLDLVPRLITPGEWETLTEGLIQRARTCEALLQDLHGERACLHDGVLPEDALRWLPQPHETAMNLHPGAVRALVSGLDLVCDAAGEWKILEDNLRIPSGIGYAMADRRVVRSVLPELQAPNGVLDADEGPAMLREALLACAPPAAGHDPVLAVVTEGPTDSAHFEHRMLAEEMGVPLLTPGELRAVAGMITMAASGRPIDVIYRRIDEEVLFSAPDAEGVPLGEPVRDAVRTGRLTLANAPGNGLVDDKGVYPFISSLTEYYFGEKATLAAVPTWSCADPEQREYVLAHLDQLVTKPVDGYGGQGIVVGPHASAAGARRGRGGGARRTPRLSSRRRPSGSPPTRRSPARRWSRASWTCGRSSSSPPPRPSSRRRSPGSRRPTPSWSTPRAAGARRTPGSCADQRILRPIVTEEATRVRHRR